mmetsp:Transcript_45266/g.88907  ORF Transcript_45266/g.88907 Transcript_45266/m.88907 type:complete len:171 (+) Transcript_45266:395-907(+)
MSRHRSKTVSEELEYDDKFDGFVSPAPAFTSLDSWDIEWEEVDFHDCPSSSEVTTGADGEKISVCFENQRWLPIKGFVASISALGSAAWTDLSGEEVPSAASSQSAPVGWVWSGDWSVCCLVVGDADGWEYSTGFKGAFGPKNKHSTVRRRRWQRHLKPATLLSKLPLVE